MHSIIIYLMIACNILFLGVDEFMYGTYVLRTYLTDINQVTERHICFRFTDNLDVDVVSIGSCASSNESLI